MYSVVISKEMHLKMMFNHNLENWIVTLVRSISVDIKTPLPDVYIPDSQTTRSSDKLPEEAIVDEEVILSLLENSATFLPHSQTSNHSSLLGIVIIWI